MRKRQRRAAGAVIGALVCAVLGGCAGSVSEKAAPAQTEIVFEEIALSDGVYRQNLIQTAVCFMSMRPMTEKGR